MNKIAIVMLCIIFLAPVLTVCSGDVDLQQTVGASDAKPAVRYFRDSTPREALVVAMAMVGQDEEENKKNREQSSEQLARLQALFASYKRADKMTVVYVNSIHARWVTRDMLDSHQSALDPLLSYHLFASVVIEEDLLFIRKLVLTYGHKAATEDSFFDTSTPREALMVPLAIWTKYIKSVQNAGSTNLPENVLQIQQKRNRIKNIVDAYVGGAKKVVRKVNALHAQMIRALEERRYSGLALKRDTRWNPYLAFVEGIFTYTSEGR